MPTAPAVQPGRIQPGGPSAQPGRPASAAAPPSSTLFRRTNQVRAGSRGESSMGYEIQHNSATYPLVFMMTSGTDHITGLTGLSPTVTISKNGGAFASPSGAVSEIGLGWYKVAGNAADANTLGPLALHATAAGADPVDKGFVVVATNPQAADGGVGDGMLTEGSLNLPQAVALILDVLAGVRAGVPTGGSGGTITIKDPTGASTRAQVTVDGAGNITAVTLTPPSV